MRYLVGIDGGGTKTDFILANEDGEILGRTRGGSTNIAANPYEHVRIELLKGLNTLVEEAKISIDDISVITFGGAGVVDEYPLGKDLLRTIFYSFIPRDTILNIVEDSVIAHEGAFAGGPGILVISGTGSNVFGKDSRGNVVKIGGLGHLFNDEGSGYNIGRRAIIAAIMADDGLGPKTMLTNELTRFYGARSVRELNMRFYTAFKENFKKSVAMCVPLVFKLANRGDHVCVEIIRDEAKILAKKVIVAIRKLHEKVKRIACVGSLLTSPDTKIFQKIFMEEVIKEYPDVSFVKPELPPIGGALLLSFKTLNIPPAVIIKKLRGLFH